MPKEIKASTHSAADAAAAHHHHHHPTSFCEEADVNFAAAAAALNLYAPFRTDSLPKQRWLIVTLIFGASLHAKICFVLYSFVVVECWPKTFPRLAEKNGSIAAATTGRSSTSFFVVQNSGIVEWQKRLDTDRRNAAASAGQIWQIRVKIQLDVVDISHVVLF